MSKNTAIFGLLLLAAIPAGAQVRYTQAFYMPEFSGCIARSNETGTFWTCSDELRTSAPSSVIWQVNFASTNILQTRPNTLVLEDMEGMAQDATGGYFIVTSQSIRNSLASPAERMQLAHYTVTGAVDRSISNFRAQLVQHCAWLGSYTNKAGKLGGLDLEGLAFDPTGNRMWLGLRGPLVTGPGGSRGELAVLLTMTNVISAGRMNTTVTWVSSSPRFLDLGGEGIRDLYWDAQTTNLFVLSGKMEATDTFTDGLGATYTKRQACHVLAYKPSTGVLTYCMRLPQVPSTPSGTATSEAEGICAINLSGVKKLLVTYDSKTNGVYQAFDFPNPSTFANPDKREGFLAQ